MGEKPEPGVCCLSRMVQLWTVFTHGPLHIDLAPAALFAEPLGCFSEGLQHCLWVDIVDCFLQSISVHFCK